MSMFNFSITTWSSLAAGLAFVGLVLRAGRRGPGLPPGPPTLPILGNVHLLRKSLTRICDWDLFYELLPKYGPIMSFVLGTKTAIILQDDGKSFRELMEKRSAIYSSRPLHSINDLTYDWDHPVSERDPYKWKLNHRLAALHFRHRMAPNTVRVQEAESTQLLTELLESPENYETHLLRFATSVLTTLAYGYRSPTANHFSLAGAEALRSHQYVVYSMPTPPIDFWPWLHYLPDWVVGWRKRSRAAGVVGDNLYGYLMDASRKLHDNELLDPDSFAYRLFEEQESHHMNDHWMIMLLGVVLEGGTDILAFTLSTTLLALLAYPDILAKAQAEVDKACDGETLPNMSHYDSLPYVRCVAKESLRWRAPFPLGVPHRLEQDDEYENYKFPKDSTIVMSIWGVHQNPERYPDPEEFKPERFEKHTAMSGDSMANPDYLTRDHYAFGAGRRSCPGIYIAEQAQILFISKFLWAFDLLPHPSSPDVSTSAYTAFEGGAIRKPKRFQFQLRPRSERRVQIIRGEMERLQEDGGLLAKKDGLMGEAEGLTSLPDGYRWTPRVTKAQTQHGKR